MADYDPWSVITCPQCGHEQRERMPTDACQYFYECTGCYEMLRPRLGDCCVFCSFGDVKCPSVQSGGGFNECRAESGPAQD